MGDDTLAQSSKNCIVTAYDVTDRKAVFFTSSEARLHAHRNYLMRDVARATSATVKSRVRILNSAKKSH